MTGFLPPPIADVAIPGLLAFEQVLMLLMHSVALGILFMLATLFLGNRLEAQGLIDSAEDAAKKKKKKANAHLEKVIGSANLLFILVGVNGVMILINNSLVRAFALVAAIALVRFRVRLSQKSLNSSFLFAVIAGVACGLNELKIAWTITGLYVFLFTALLVILRVTAPRDAKVPVAEPTTENEGVAVGAKKKKKDVSLVPPSNDLSGLALTQLPGLTHSKVSAFKE